jgi:hypothetical protein
VGIATSCAAAVAAPMRKVTAIAKNHATEWAGRR